MSKILISEMTVNQARELLNKIADIFSIGEAARCKSTILTNVENCSRRSNCLFKIEQEATRTVIYTGDNEEYDESLLNWGDEPNDYIEQFKKVFKLKE